MTYSRMFSNDLKKNSHFQDLFILEYSKNLEQNEILITECSFQFATDQYILFVSSTNSCNWKWIFAFIFTIWTRSFHYKSQRWWHWCLQHKTVFPYTCPFPHSVTAPWRLCICIDEIKSKERRKKWRLKRQWKKKYAKRRIQLNCRNSIKYRWIIKLISFIFTTKTKIAVCVCMRASAPSSVACFLLRVHRLVHMHARQPTRQTARQTDKIVWTCSDRTDCNSKSTTERTTSEWIRNRSKKKNKIWWKKTTCKRTKRTAFVNGVSADSSNLINEFMLVTVCTHYTR